MLGGGYQGLEPFFLYIIGIFNEQLDLMHPLFHDPGKDGIYNRHSDLCIILGSDFLFSQLKILTKIEFFGHFIVGNLLRSACEHDLTFG